MGPRNLRLAAAVAGVAVAVGRYEAMAESVVALGRMLALVALGAFANFTVIGSVAPSGIVPLSTFIVFSASCLWSKRMKPTPLEIPVSKKERNV